MKIFVLVLCLCLALGTNGSFWRTVGHAISGFLGDTETRKFVTDLRDMDEESYDRFMDELGNQLQRKMTEDESEEILRNLDDIVNRDSTANGKFSIFDYIQDRNN